MKGIARITKFRLDVNGYKKDLETVLVEGVKEATKAYLKAVIRGVIPVWSGASVATFLKLASEVDATVNIAPVVPSRIGLGSGTSTGKLEVDMSAGTVFAVYSTSLPHLVYNEYNNANSQGLRLKRPGPYGFQQVGASVFQTRISKIQLPDATKRIKRV